MAFYGRSKLKKIGIPNSVMIIGESAFSNWPSLEPIYTPEELDLGNNDLFDVQVIRYQQRPPAHSR